MKAANPWTTYRTRFLVKAKQLATSLTFTDILGRQHSGVKGDYLVESSEGLLSIAPRQIFEDIYVPLVSARDAAHHTTGASRRCEPQPPRETLRLPESLPQRKPSSGLQHSAIFPLPSHLTRKASPAVREGLLPADLRSL